MSFCCFKPFFGVFLWPLHGLLQQEACSTDDLNWMTLNSHFAPYTVTFLVESFTMDALVLRHDCFKIHRDAHILSAAKIMLPTVCGFWRHTSCRYSSGFAAEVVSDESAVVENVTCSLAIAIIFHYELHHWLYISEFTWLCAVSRRQHGSCCNWLLL